MVFVLLNGKSIKKFVMKTIILKKLLTTYLIIFSGIITHAQSASTNSSTMQEEEVQCELELSNMAEFMKIDLPDYAYSAWKKLFDHCPDASKNIYISGAKIFKDKLRKAKDVQRKEELFDTLMMIYDRRIEYFGDEGYVLGRKGMDIIRYNEKEYPKAYEAFSRSSEVSGDETDYNVLTGLIQTSAVMLKNDKITAAEFLDDYLQATAILEAQKESGTNPAKIKRVQAIMDRVLSETRIDDCNAIENALSEKVNSPEVEGDFLKLSRDLLTLSGCENTSFFSSINEKLMKLDPDPELAYEVARYSLKNDDFEKASEYLQKAIDNEEEPEQKALYEYQLAVIKLSKLNQPQEAKELAMMAAEHKENWGEPYLVAANAIIEGISMCNMEAFEKQAVYWLAADYVYRAKQADPEVEDRANDLLSRYRTNYPSVEDTFFRSLNKGDSYKIGCWINETTTVKIR
jgi:tetratricopeptide (TPR) repeat protein